MRIVGGRFRGRRLEAPRGRHTRPTTDRVREAIFGRLDAHGRIDGARVADLFAGTGAMGLEALSRGAAGVVAFERDRHALAALKRNVESLLGPDRPPARHRVVGRPLPRGLRGEGAFSLALCDPPWGKALAVEVAAALAAVDGGGLEVGGWLVLEERHGAEGSDAEWAERGYEAVDRRRYGDAAVLVLERVR